MRLFILLVFFLASAPPSGSFRYTASGGRLIALGSPHGVLASAPPSGSFRYTASGGRLIALGSPHVPRLAPSPVELSIVQFPARGKVSLALGARSKAEVERTGTVTRVSVQIDALLPPASVTARMNTYVVWVVSPEGSFENLGELEIDGTKGTLTATTRFDRFGIFLTAEPHYMVDKPNSTIVFQNETPKAVLSVPLTVETGAYEYNNLPENTAAAPSLVMEARAALAIAYSVNADRRADGEFRQAKAALDTMEELVTRGSPPEVIAAAANVAIRRAHRAATAARQTFR